MCRTPAVVGFVSESNQIDYQRSAKPLERMSVIKLRPPNIVKTTAIRRGYVVLPQQRLFERHFERSFTLVAELEPDTSTADHTEVFVSLLMELIQW